MELIIFAIIIFGGVYWITKVPYDREGL